MGGQILSCEWHIWKCCNNVIVYRKVSLLFLCQKRKPQSSYLKEISLAKDKRSSEMRNTENWESQNIGYYRITEYSLSVAPSLDNWLWSQIFSPEFKSWLCLLPGAWGNSHSLSFSMLISTMAAPPLHKEWRAQYRFTVKSSLQHKFLQ